MENKKISNLIKQSLTSVQKKANNLETNIRTALEQHHRSQSKRPADTTNDAVQVELSTSLQMSAAVLLSWSREQPQEMAKARMLILARLVNAVAELHDVDLAAEEVGLEGALEDGKTDPAFQAWCGQWEELQ